MVDIFVPPLYAALSCRCERTRSRAHGGAITGIAVNAGNTLLVTVGLDAYLRIWDFQCRALQNEIALFAPASRLAHHPGSDLVAVACDDLGLYMCAPCAMQYRLRMCCSA